MSEYKLTKEIIKLSESNTWDQAKLEWELYKIYMVDDPQRCLCSHYPIREICELRNKINKKITVVGNCCVKKFMGLPSQKIFQAVKKIKKDVESSVNEELLNFVQDKKWINDWEYGFYLDIRLKRKLSYKQLQIKIMINRKILYRVLRTTRLYSADSIPLRTLIGY